MIFNEYTQYYTLTDLEVPPGSEKDRVREKVRASERYIEKESERLRETPIEREREIVREY